MSTRRAGGQNPPDSAGETAQRPYRIDWHNVDERRRERAHQEAAGASRDLPARELVGGGV
ncbi:hypothetical protein C437_15366 [Haloarcula vallismortis ATCC 29715]|uniref:Uncharacterized protein n=1 Tax=Haloarcula vallismortis ATCC 29715 TaxID=662477 RepID=M0IYJ9_HALVA|nr:hypothetical protein [Haloarcula vallismortis]EMA01811.1 hypothetical protein C437_15366 [Haloarcula vallismortis ATCC 29715]